MESFYFSTWCTATKLTDTSVDILKKEDLDTAEADGFSKIGAEHRVACSRLSDSGEDAKVKSTRKVGGAKKSP